MRTQLKLALRTGRTRQISLSRVGATKGKILDMVNISERPKEAGDRAVPGFWGRPHPGQGQQIADRNIG